MKGTYNIEQLAEILKKKVGTIYNHRSSKPHAVPPSVEGHFPLIWEHEVVQEWFEQRRPKKKGRPREISA